MHGKDLTPEDLVNRSIRERDDEQIAIRSALDICDDTKIASNEKAFTFCDLMLGKVICHSVLKARVIHSDLSSITCQIKMEQIASFQKRCGRSHEEIILELRSQCAVVDKPHSPGRHFQL